MGIADCSEHSRTVVGNLFVERLKQKNSSIIKEKVVNVVSMMIWLHIAESFRFHFPSPYMHERRTLSISGTCKTIID